MNILGRYIAVSVFFNVLLVLFVIVSLDMVFAFMAELQDVQGNYQAIDALFYIITTSPRRIYGYTPVSTLIGTLVGLGLLANNNELVVMRSAGISILRIVLLATLPVIFFVLLGLVLSQYVVPGTEQIAQSERAIKESGSNTLKINRGHWHRENDSYIHINAIQASGVVYGFTRFRFAGELQLVETLFAEKAYFEGDHWRLENIKLTHIEPTTTRIEFIDTMRWDTVLTPALLNVVILEPENLSISSLYNYSHYRQQQGVESTAYFLAFWTKALQPLATLAMVFIAASFIFGPLRSVTMGSRVTAGIVTGLIFKYAQELSGHASVVYEVPPLLAAGLPIALCFIVALGMLVRGR
jgi:lipopolysaccharide export system permease protein